VRRHADLFWCALAITGLAAWSLLHWYFDERAWLDDAWISFKYARALISGEGLTYNLEDGPVEGFTNFAWVMFVAIAMKLGAAPEVFARTLGLTSHLAAVALIASLGWRKGAKTSAGKVAALVVAAIPGATHGLLGIAGSGLETAFAALLLVLLAELSDSVPSRATVVGITFLLCTTRPDGLLFVGCWFVVMLLFHRARWRELFFTGVCFAVPFAALLAWKASYFGSFVPNTYFAKSADLPAWNIGWAFWNAFALSEPGVIGLALLLLALSFRFLRAWMAFALTSLSLYVLYVAKVGGDFMEYRFAYQVIPLLCWSVARGLVELRAEHTRLIAVGLVSACLALGLLPARGAPYGFAPLVHMNRLVGEGLTIGARLHEVLPANTRLATTLAGTLPYEWGGFVVDEWGLTDAYVAHLPDRPVANRGHVKFAPVSYLEKRGVNLVVDHPHVCSCAKGCEIPFPQVYVRIAGDQCLRTRYLVQTPELTRRFCTDPNFVVRGVDCDVNKQVRVASP
jgi:arabinofuranosyltransferase